MNTLELKVSNNLTHSSMLKTILFYIFIFLLLYSEPISIGGTTISILWKIIFLAVIIFPTSKYILETKQIEPFVLFAILLSIKMLFSISSMEYFNHTIGIIAKNLMFPILFLLFSIRLNQAQLIYIAKHFSILIVLSFVPFILGILDPLSEGYTLKDFGILDSFGLIGVFQTAHSASETLGIVLIVLFYFFQNEKNKYMKFIYLGLLGLGFYELILTYARSGLLIAIVGIFYLWIKEKGIKKYITAIVFGVPIVLIFIYMYITNPVFEMRLNDENEYSRKSGQVREIGSGRPTIAKAALKNWYEEGFVGHTIGLGYMYGITKMDKAGVGKIFAHNGFIQILQQEGLIGIILFFLFLYSLLKYILRFKSNKYYTISMALFLAYIMEKLLQGNFVFALVLLLAIFLALMKKQNLYLNLEQ